MIHKIDLNILRDSIDYIGKIAKSFKTIDHLEQTLQEKIRIAKEKLFSLHPHRNRRGIVNALGSVIKLIAGNPDNEDVETIHRNLEEIRVQENKLTHNENRQIQINELFRDKINNITDTIYKISTRISKQYNTIQDQRSDLEFINLIWSTDRIIQILGSIEEQIEFSKVGLINKDVLSLKEKQIIFRKLINQNIKLNFIDEIFRYSTGSIGLSGDKAVLLTKTPILDQDTYDLLELHTLNINGSRIATQVNRVAKNGNQIFLQTTDCDICEGNNFIRDKCVYHILTHQKPTCPLMKTKQTPQITEVTNGLILIDTLDNIEINDSCGDSRMVKEATIVETGNCSITIKNITYSGTARYFQNEEYLAPIYTKELQTTNYTDEGKEMLHFKIQNLEELQDVKFSAHQTQIRIISGGLLLLILTSLYLFLRRFSKERTSERRNRNKDAQTPQLQSIAIMDDKPKADIGKSKLESIPLPRLKLFEDEQRS